METKEEKKQRHVVSYDNWKSKLMKDWKSLAAKQKQENRDKLIEEILK